MMALMIAVALANGMLVVTSRMINARLGREVTPAGASVWNHVTGAATMGILVLFMGRQDIAFANIPVIAYLGGVIGAGYVTVSNFIIPKIGASKATVLMIAGQIALAALIDSLRGILTHPPTTIAGIALIILGVSLKDRRDTPTGD